MRLGSMPLNLALSSFQFREAWLASSRPPATAVHHNDNIHSNALLEFVWQGMEKLFAAFMRAALGFSMSPAWPTSYKM